MALRRKNHPGDSRARARPALILFLTLTLCPPTPAVEFAAGTGDPNDPYQITTAEQLIAIGADPNLLDKHFVLVADIDLDPNLPGKRVFTHSIIAPDSVFSGGFDGAGHTIRNLTIDAPDKDNVGLFGYLRSRHIANLVLENASVSGRRYVGTLAGYNGGDISSCLSSGVVKGIRSHIGGLAGCNYTGSITDSRFTGAVCGGEVVGGLVGSNNGDISNCWASSEVAAEVRVGGLTGENGVMHGDILARGSIQNSYAEGTVQGRDCVGGLVGFNAGDGEVSDCYAAAHVSGVTNVGGLVGQGNRSYARDCFWDVDAAGQTVSAAGIGKTMSQMTMLRTFRAWGCNGAWTIDDGADYPRLAWEGLPGCPIEKPEYGGGAGTEADPYLIYTADQLNNIGLAQCDWDKHFKLMADIDCAEMAETAFSLIGYNAWYQQRSAAPFTGVLDGNGRTIANLCYACQAADYVGLIRCMAGDACVRDLSLRDPNISVVAGWYAGALVGYMEGSRIVNCHVEGGKVSGDQNVGGLIGGFGGIEGQASVTGCSFEGLVVGRSTVGGLAGISGAFDVDGSVLMDCSVTAEVSGDSGVGGLVGTNFSPRLARCRSEGTIAGDNNVGGLAAYNYIGGCITDSSSCAEVLGGENASGFVAGNFGVITRCRSQGIVSGTNELGGFVAVNGKTVEQCCATGPVKGNDTIGGFVGTNHGLLSDCYSTGSVSGREMVGGFAANNYWGGDITRCYATGRVTSKDYVGGLVGGSFRSSSTACFWDVQTTGLSQSAAGSGLTTAQMWMAATLADAGWDFENVWMICEGRDYPRLRWEGVECDGAD